MEKKTAAQKEEGIGLTPYIAKKRRGLCAGKNQGGAAPVPYEFLQPSRRLVPVGRIKPNPSKPWKP
jgi:hypothetical protein